MLGVLLVILLTDQPADAAKHVRRTYLAGDNFLDISPQSILQMQSSDIIYTKCVHHQHFQKKYSEGRPVYFWRVSYDQKQSSLALK